MTRKADLQGNERPGTNGTLAGEGLRMGVLSVASLVLGYLLTIMLHEFLRIPAEAAFTVAVVVCSILNFFGFRYYILRGSDGHILVEAAKFFPTMLLFRSFEVGLFAMLHRVFENYHLAYVATTGISASLKLLVSRIWIFKRQR